MQLHREYGIKVYPQVIALDTDLSDFMVYIEMCDMIIIWNRILYINEFKWLNLNPYRPGFV